MRRSYSKYRVSQVSRRNSPEGERFDSRAEMLRFQELQLLEKSGAIADLRKQVSYPLILPNGVPIKIRSAGFPNGRQCVYTADAVYRETESGEEIVEDTKSPATMTGESKLRIAIWEAVTGRRVRINLAGGRQGKSNGKTKSRR